MRPSKSYRDMNKPANTRKEFIKRFPAVPDGLKRMTYGDVKKQFEAKVKFVSTSNRQISAKSIESIRVTVQRQLSVLGENNYMFRILTYPHHVVREHGLTGVAKAERLAKGMRHSFGAPQYRMARIKKGQAILEIDIHDDAVAYGIVRKTLHALRSKISQDWRVDVEGVSSSNLCANPILPKRIKESKRK